MTGLRTAKRIVFWTAAAVGVAAAAYAALAAMTWYEYGTDRRARGADEEDPLLDRFMPRYEVAERHHIAVDAPTAITLAASIDQDLLQSPVIRTIFKARELILRSAPDAQPRPRGLLELTRSLGWGILAEVPGREIVVGAITKPWEANVTFHALPPDEFAAFAKPGFVKIAWTLRADPVHEHQSIFRTETRAIATDSISRSYFRRYWTRFSPGIRLIRRMSLAPVKAEAQRRWREQPHVRMSPDDSE